MKNKIISIVLSLIFVFACYPTASANTDNQYFSEANILLTGLGFEDASSKANETISREALLKLLVDNSFYEGIDYDDLAMMGIYADANFYFLPGNQICLKDALIICVKLLTLGSDEIDDYDRLTIAWDLDLNEGISVELDKPLSYSDAYILLYNYLNADISVYNGRFAIGNTTILADKHHIDIVTGIVDKAGRFALDGDALPDGKISVGGKVYKSEKYGEDIFARYVTAYIRDSETVVAATVTDSVVTEIYSSDDPEFESNAYVFYNEKGNKERVKISQSADMFCNGSYFSFDKAMAVPENGKITIIDNGTLSDGADVVIIDSAKSVRVDGINRSEELIYSGGKNYPFDENTLIIDDKGRAKAFSDISSGDLISLYINQENIVSKCVKLTGRISGTLDSISNDYITVNSVKYKITSDIKDSVSSALGKSVTAYADEYGTVVYVEEGSASNLNVGITRAVRLIEKGLSSNLKALIYTDAGVETEFEFAEKVKVNNRLCKTFSETYSALPKVNGNIKQSIVAYELGSDGKIAAVDFPSDKIMDVEGDSRIYKTSHDPLSTFSHVTYNKWREDFGEGVFITPETKVFRIPRQLADGTINDNLQFYSATVCSAMITGTAYHNNTSTGYGFDKESKISSVVVLEYDASGGSGSVMPELTPMSIVGSMSRVLTPEGDEAEAVTLYDYVNPEGRLIYGDSLDYFSSRNIQPGDLVRVEYADETGQASMVELVYKNGSETLENGDYLYTGSGGGKGQEADIRLCKVYKKWGTVLDLVYANTDMENVSDSDIKSVKGAGYGIYRYDSQRRRLEILTLDDVLSYDISGDNCSEVVMYDVSFSPASLIIIN